MNSDAMIDVDPIHARLTALTPGTWRRHGGDIFAGDQTTPLLRGRDGTAEVRAQSDADAEFVAHAAADIAALLDQLGNMQEGGTPHRGGEAEIALSPQADRRRRRSQASSDRRTVTDWLRRLPRQ